MEDMEPELVNYCNQDGLPVVELKHQSTHKTFKWQPLLPARRFVATNNQWLVRLEAQTDESESIANNTW